MDNLHLLISELFYSLQGESTRAGLPCAFIRMSDCNLRCKYCDSSYTWEEQGKRMSQEEILLWLAPYPGVMVELTGGEPLLQDGVYPLMDELLIKKRTVLVETNGSLSIGKVPDKVHVIFDIKCPDSGMSDRMDWGNLKILANRKKNNSQDEIKFVLSSEEDYRWARSIITEHHLAQLAPLLFSPVENTFPVASLAELMLHDQIPARLQLQLHRVIWPAKDRGV